MLDVGAEAGTTAPSNAPDDRLLVHTFWTAALIVPVLVAAFVILFRFPGHTRRLWAWTISPEMTSLTTTTVGLAVLHLALDRRAARSRGMGADQRS